MRALIDAIIALLKTAGYTAYWVDVPAKPSYPYVLLWGPSWGTGEQSLSADDSLEVHVYATCVAVTPANALDVSKYVRKALHGSMPAAVGRTAEMRYVRSEVSGVDREVTLPDTGQHPGYAVDTYLLVSDPT